MRSLFIIFTIITSNLLQSQESYYEFSHTILKATLKKKSSRVDETYDLCNRSNEFMKTDFFIEAIKKISKKGFAIYKDGSYLKRIKISNEVRSKLSDPLNWVLPTTSECDCTMKFWNQLYLGERPQLVDKNVYPHNKYAPSKIIAIIKNEEYILFARSNSDIINVFILMNIDDQWLPVAAHSNLSIPDE